MSTHGRGATDDYSSETAARTGPSRGLPLAARGAAGVGLAGAALAVVATFTPVIEITVLTVETFSHDGWDRYGPALVLLAVFAVLMVAGAWRGARPAMAGLAIAGLAIIAIAVLVDVPHLDDKGVWPLADQYEDAQAGAGIGFYFETAAGVLMLLGGVLMLLLAPRSAASAPASAAPARGPEPASAPAADTEWFAESRAQRLTQPQTRRKGGLVGRFRGRR